MCVRFSPNEEFILGASNDNAARLWSVEQGRIRHTLTGHIGKVGYLLFVFPFPPISFSLLFVLVSFLIIFPYIIFHFLAPYYFFLYIILFKIKLFV